MKTLYLSKKLVSKTNDEMRQKNNQVWIIKKITSSKPAHFKSKKYVFGLVYTNRMFWKSSLSRHTNYPNGLINKQSLVVRVFFKHKKKWTSGVYYSRSYIIDIRLRKQPVYFHKSWENSCDWLKVVKMNKYNNNLK